MSVCLSVCLPVCIYVYMSVCMYIYVCMSVCIYVCLYVCLSVCLNILAEEGYLLSPIPREWSLDRHYIKWLLHPARSLSVCMCVCLSVCLSIRLFVTVINIFKTWLAYKSKTTYPIWTNLTFLNSTDQTTLV